MWEWFTDSSIWILVGAGLVVFLLLSFSERARGIISKVVPEKWQEKTYVNVTTAFWTIEGIAVAVMVLAFIAINQIIGPVLLQKLLVKVNEAGKKEIGVRL